MSGLFGGLSPAASGYGSPMNWADMLTLIGAGLKDASPTSGGGNLQAAQGMMAQRGIWQAQQSALRQLPGLFGGQAATAPTYAEAPQAADSIQVPGLFGTDAPQAQPASYLPQRMSDGTPATGPDFSRIATAAPYLKMLGIDVAPSIEALKAGQPNVQYINGVRYDGKNLATAPSFVPQFDKGQEPLYDARGNIVGIRNMDGSVKAAADMAGAVASAQETAKAGYNLVDVPIGGGRTQKMPAAIAAPILAAQAAKFAGASAAPGAATGGADGLGVVPSPDEQALATDRAKTQGEREAGVQGARNAMQQVDDQTNMIAQNLHDMLGETQDPNTGKWVKTKPSMITGLSSGSGVDIISHVPFLNQQAKDLAGKIETVRNGTSFNSMQAIKGAMAAAGDGGSASMRMTDQTARMLGEINGSLNQDQSGPQFEATVRRHLAQLDALNRARHDLFESQYQGIKTPTPGQTGPKANYGPNLGSVPMADRIAEAKRRGLLK